MADAPSRVLQVQELCDHIADHLDMPTCRDFALVSSQMVPSAQRCLFRAIRLNPAGGSSTPNQAYDEAKACRRLCAILQASPHLVPLIRSLDVALEYDVLQLLLDAKFPNLQAINL
ncbi:hypothetical protein K438DRAFT_1962642 [Mycena galopus ATCC 62051]|nr:hypothetical protein K438DRAFT_1962642 [Mycena galopus ATCC 62051]